MSTLKHALHHGFVALVLACAILIAEQHGWLNWLDSLSLRFATALSQGTGPTADKTPEASKPDQPIVLLISDEMFERDFGQASPLNRAKLAEILNRIVEQNPEAIAIDLDLSPGPVDEQNDDQKALNAALVEAAKSISRVIISTPFSVRSNSLVSLKARWMKQLCDSGVQFGYAFVQTNQGLVLRYPSKTDSIGRLLANATEDASVDATPCDLVKKGEQYAAFLSKDYPEDILIDAKHLAHQLPINAGYFRSNLPILLDGIADVKRGRLNKKMVVLGSGFNPNDEFLTAYGAQKGAIIHAAVAFSERHQIKVLQHTMAILLDVVLGIIAGFLFHAIWAKYNVANDAAIANGYRPFRFFLIARLWLAGSFGIVFVWVAMLMAMSAWLLQHSLWGNPGPMIIGVFVKTILASRPRGHQHPINQKRCSMLAMADELLFVPVLIWGVVAFFSAH